MLKTCQPNVARLLVILGSIRYVMRLPCGVCCFNFQQVQGTGNSEEAGLFHSLKAS
jgi:hypothetical protein